MYETKENKDGSTTIEPAIVYRRNDPNQNPKNPIQLMFARANVDCKVTENDRKTLSYVTKYVTKAEGTSASLKNLIKESASSTSQLEEAKKVYVKTMNKAVGAREVFHELMSVDYYHSSHQVVAAPLLNKRRLRNNINGADPDVSADENSLLDRYAHRRQCENEYPDICHYNYQEFVARFCIVSGQLKRRKCQVIPRPFPTYSSNAQGTNYHQYCRFQLLQHKPWEENECQVWGGSETPDAEELIQAWAVFLQSPIG